MRARFISLMLMLALLWIAPGSVRAQTDGGRGFHQPLLLATYLVFGGVYEFYQVYERWPLSWQEVALTGIVQVPLVTDANEPINPDDGRLDFFGDVMYRYIPNVSGPEVQIMLDRTLAQSSSTALAAPLTFRELFERVPDSAKPLLPSLDDKPRMLQLALAALCHEGISRYASAHGNLFPGSWEQYLDSGFAPITRSSLNWLTGSVFYGDGRANDLLYRVVSETEFDLLPTDGSSRPLVLPFEIPVCPWQCPLPIEAGYEHLK